MRTIYFCLLLFMFSCANQNLKSNIDFTVIQESDYGTEMEKQQTLIRDQDAFENLFQKVNKNIQPKPNTPEIDFDKYDVLFLHFGSYNHGGHIFEVSQVEWQGRKLIVRIFSPKLDGDSPVTMALTNPYVFIKIDKLKRKPKSIELENI